MGVTVQDDIDILRKAVWRNMNETEPNAVSFQIDGERPLEIAVAISTNHSHWRTERLQGLQDARRANIAQVPDLVGARSERLDFGGQLIVGIGENKNLQARSIWHLFRGVSLWPLCEA